jgi:porin
LLWEGSSLTTHVELRHGETPLLAGGTLIPTNSALLFPEREGTHARVSSLYFTQIFGGKYVLQGGRFDTLDLYSAHPFTGGEGVERFMNLSLVAPPLSARTVPPVTEGVLFSVLRGPTPWLTLGVIESTEEGFFENGTTFMWSVSPPWKFSAKPGGISVGGEIGSFEGTSLDQSPWALLPDLPIPLEEEQGAWTVNVSVDQFLAMHPSDPTKGWGIFGMFGVSDGNPSFLELQGFIGLGGAAPFTGRSRDSWGVAYFVNGVSDDLKDTLDPLIRTRDERGVELYYSWAPVGWSRLTADLQVIDPFLVRAETRTFFALRWQVIF